MNKEELSNEVERLRKVLFTIASRNVFLEFPSTLEFETDAREVCPNRVEWLRDIAAAALAKEN